jgi:hypothetical protein
MRLSLSIRWRLTLLYCLVLGLSFVVFFYICDIGFKHSIETTVNEASRGNLEIIRRLLESSTPSGQRHLQKELSELAGERRLQARRRIEHLYPWAVFRFQELWRPLGVLTDGQHADSKPGDT